MDVLGYGISARTLAGMRRRLPRLKRNSLPSYGSSKGIFPLAPRILTRLGPLFGIGLGEMLVPPKARNVPTAAVLLAAAGAYICTVPERVYPTPGVHN